MEGTESNIFEKIDRDVIIKKKAGSEEVKKTAGIIIFLLITVVTMAVTEGIEYYSKNEIEALGVVVEGDTLIYEGNKVRIEGARVWMGEYSVLFPEAVITKKGSTYYNSFLIEAVEGSYEDEVERERIISLSPGVTEKIFALGMGDELAGRTVYCNYPEEAKKVEDVGSMLEPSLEKVMVKNPEIILMEAHYNKGFVNQLKRVGVDYRIYDTPKSLEEMYEHLTDLGKELGVERRAYFLAASLKSTAAKYTRLSEEKGVHPSVYYVLGTGRAEYTAGGDTFIGDIIEHSGGMNIAGAKKGWTFTLEELITKNPQYIIGSKKDMDILRGDKKYSLLRAVREGNLIEVDTDVYNLPGVRAVNEGIPVIYEAIYRGN